MTKFEEELSSLPVSQSTKYTEYWNKAQLLTVFKDWQPQQDLPVVPEYVAKIVELLKKNPETSWSKLCEALGEEGVTWLNEFQHKDERFGFGELNSKLIVLFHLAINGYTVEEPQLFYLRNKLTGLYLYKKPLGGYGEDPASYIKDLTDDFKFTQKEIDGMDVQSYEKKDEYKGE